MSETEALYFYKDIIAITDFKKIYIDDEEISSRIDTLIVAKPKDYETYKVSGQKNGNAIKIVPNDMKVESITIERDYSEIDDGSIYRITLRRI